MTFELRLRCVASVIEYKGNLDIGGRRIGILVRKNKMSILLLEDRKDL